MREDHVSVYCPACRDFSPAGSRTCISCGTRIRGSGTDADSSQQEGKAIAFGVAWDPVIATVWLLALGILYALVFILPLSPMHHPLIRLVVLLVAMILSTAAMVFIDSAVANPDNSLDDRFNYTPGQWFAFVLLVWPVGFPFYFWNKARQYPDKSNGIAMAEAAVFLLILMAAWALISARSHNERYITGAATHKPPPTHLLQINGQSVNVAGKGAFVVQASKPTAPARRH